MGVTVIADNVADLPAEVASRMGIIVVPLGVQFGLENIENLDPDLFYRRLVQCDPLPTTSAPTPEAYAAAYRAATTKGDDAVVITISKKLSATHEVALKARDIVDTECRIEVVDSGLATMAQGFVAIKAAEAAQSGAEIDAVVKIAKQTIGRVGFLAAFDTLEYLRRGGRIGAAKALLGSVLNIQPLVTLRDGLVAPFGRARSRAQALSKLVEFAGQFTRIEAFAIEHTACAADASELKVLLQEKYPEITIYESRATPVIGTHTGPGLVVLSVLGDRTTE